MKEGEISKLISTQDASYIVRLDKKTDEKATADNKKQIVEKRKQDEYEKVLKAWQKKDGWKVKKSVVKKVSYKNDLSKKQKEK